MLLVAASAPPAPHAAGGPAGGTGAAAPLDCRLRCDFYKVKRRSTRVVVTLAAPADQFRDEGDEVQGPDLRLSVALDDAKSGKPAGSFAAAMRRVDGASGIPGRSWHFQGEFTIDPGTYRAVFTILDQPSSRAATRIESIAAPDFGRRLALSSIAIGRKREEPDDTALIPEPDAVFHEGETIAFAYEVYNAEHKGGATPDLDVKYEFFVDAEGGPRPAGRPVLLHRQRIESLDYSLPLLGWPEAAYRVRVQVTDNRTGASATGEAPFRVIGRAR